MNWKYLFQLLIAIFLLIISYFFGYYNATKNTEFMLSTYSAKLSLATLNYLKNNELEKIHSLHDRNIENSIAGIKFASKLDNYQIDNFKEIYNVYRLYGIDSKEKERMSKSIFDQYSNIKQ